MLTSTYNDLARQLDGARERDDKEALENIKARINNEYGRDVDNYEDIKTLFKYHG